MKNKKLIISIVVTIIVSLSLVYFYISSRSYSGTFQGINIKNDTTMLLIGDSKENAKELTFLKLNKYKRIIDKNIKITCTNNGSKDISVNNFMNDLAIGVTDLKISYLLGKVRAIEYSFDDKKLKEYKEKVQEDRENNLFIIKLDNIRINNGSNIARYSYIAPKHKSSIYGVSYDNDNIKVEKFTYLDGKMTRVKDNVDVDQSYIKKFKFLLYSSDIPYNEANLFDVGFKTEEDLKNKSIQFASDLMDEINKVNDAELSDALKLELMKNKLVNTN